MKTQKVGVFLGIIHIITLLSNKKLWQSITSNIINSIEQIRIE